jgi:hypothetical protein
MPVSFNELLEAFLFVDVSGGIGEHSAYLCRRTGKIYLHSEFYFDERPEDIDDEEKYLVISDKRELDLGKPLVLDFAREFLPDDFDEVRYIFSKRGAYQKFKALRSALVKSRWPWNGSSRKARKDL